MEHRTARVNGIRLHYLAAEGEAISEDGHFLAEEQPDRVAVALRHFLK
jgi:hypothetical protein